MASEDMEKDLYKNWVRGAKGLEYLQEGLQDFVGDKVQLCRNQSLQKIINGLPTGSVRQCNQCTSQNLLPEHAKKKNACNRNTCTENIPYNCFGSKPKDRRKCKKKICSKLYDEIVLDHSSRDPLWKNTDPSTWCSDPLGWSFGKCFQTTTGSGSSACTTDAAGLLSILINNTTIQNNWLACNDMSSKITCPFNRARDIRNAIMHSSKLELDEPVLGYYLDTFMTVLQDAKCLLNYNGSKQAVDKLLQLKNHQINISLKDETRLVQNRKEALSELKEMTAEGLREIDERIVAAKTKLEEANRVAELNIRDKTKAALSELGKRKAERLCEIEKTEIRATLNFIVEKVSALSDIEQAKKGAEQDVNERTKAAMSELEQARKGAAQDVKKITKDALSELEEAKKSVQECTKVSLSELEGARKGAETSTGLTPHLSAAEDAYLKRKTDLRDDLVTFYKDTHSSIPLSPLFEEHDTPLVDFYVLPQMNSIEVQNLFPEGREIKTPVKLSDMFKSGNKWSREIYLIAEAGLGKTAFSKYLAVTWCQAHRPEKEFEKYFPEDAIDVMREFDFLFLVFLRDSSEGCSIDNLIVNQIVQNLSLSCTMTVSSLQEILHRERCLVILDALDEWTHPGEKCVKVPTKNNPSS
ncbi:uncharacterized protein LOC123527475 isoform X3 [Mercenaria mercenaria]|uniref:uncharacterized protein LOC123527475 isoform X3 n=1 Tax=Mercenaria mercenaria TaxID=6596 RepID=UPI00234EDE00|nr:uncharacterized protein LOC123527475 isoform X3 [Mercenaria mercenaria]XP_053379348.1 uncharacterized protein LOC123527475 isoform X3 [Mercenaria mercenaria]XP_053379350.1 uncharacterized protein LOC123527475 isoform X3 [Mercenaria mercenaria]XP_053379351.1 uncharacterized protein LOC123527475 isoform X3 [Mercenaria mercenaria]XP_053379352.1 uncharacterized protein LOC123527475 isoform X3 [Mercenaria mercenaria]